MTLTIDSFSNQIAVFKDEDLFDRFWAVYPRKDSKKKARAAFKKINPNLQLLDLIINNIQQRIESGSWRLTEKQYIPIPTTYLNGERWEDEIIQVTKNKGIRSLSSPESLHDTSW